MFTEKDKRMAKNYVAERNPTGFETNGIFVRERITQFVLQEIERAFLAGLNLYKPKWHKVADEDLPKEQKEYWCKVFYYESEETFNAFLWFDPDTKKFTFQDAIGEDDESGFSVKEWCEIPKE